MTLPRKALICVEDTPYYHIISRCVRRSFLCGIDHATGNDYSHRRLFIEQRIHLLSSLFAIDIAAYAVMSNHLHLVVKLSPKVADEWTYEEVVARWTSLFNGPLLIQKFSKGLMLTKAEQTVVNDIIGIYLQRLTDLGWFMKCLNEPIARMANKEDNCRGHFWEALLSSMAYVDLNPVRAKIAASPEESDHTSIKECLQPSLNLASQ